MILPISTINSYLDIFAEAHKFPGTTNALWGSPRIRGEMLKLGIEISERTVARLMPKKRNPSSQTWRTFLDNHVKDLVSIDFFLVPTAAFRVLFVLVVLAHDRRRVVHFVILANPGIAWVWVSN
jgi:hypothetical protein